MTKTLYPALHIEPRTFTVAEKNALTRRARALQFELSRCYSDVHPVVQLLNAACFFHSYEMKHAALTLWEGANEEQRRIWRELGEFHLQGLLWHAEHTPGFGEKLRGLLGMEPPPKRKRRPARPGELRLRPHYLRVVQ